MLFVYLPHLLFPLSSAVGVVNGGVALSMRTMSSSSPMVLRAAGTSELVRTNQKDRYYSSYLGTLLADIINPYIPQRYWVGWQRELELVGELLYYGLTTVRGNQTLGEEYTNTVQVIDSPLAQGHVVPGTLRRTFAVVLQIFGRYLLEKFLYMFKELAINHRLPVSLSAAQYKVLIWIAVNAADVVSSTNQLHLALFYLRGVYYSIGKRIAGIHYLMVQYEHLATPTNPYKLLGILLLLQTLYKLVRVLIKGFETNDASSEEYTGDVNINDEKSRSNVGVSTSLKCALCLDACSVPTTTACGHVMCWSCCAEWIREREECPICRTALEPHQLTPLQNFEMY